MTARVTRSPQAVAIIEAARSLQDLHVYVTPVHGKVPFLEDWTDLRLTEPDFQNYFVNGEGLGVLLGLPPDYLVDMDIDDMRALQCVAQNLIAGAPNTGWVFGRKSKPRSHRVYKFPGEFKTVAFEDDITPEANVARGEKESHMLLELRGTGGQTVFPPTLHEESKEQRAWEAKPTKQNLGESNGSILHAYAARVATATLLARHYPLFKKGHKFALAFSGWLGLSGWNEEQVKEVVTAAAKLAKDPDWEERRRNVESTFKRLEDGNKEVEQRKHLEELFGENGKKLCKTIAKWLSLKRIAAASVDVDAHDLANADIVEQSRGEELAYECANDVWYIADHETKRWARNREVQVLALIGDVLRARLVNTAANKKSSREELKWAVQSCDARRISSCQKILRGRSGFTSDDEEAQFDTDPLLIGVRNGIVDLNTGKLLTERLDLRVSKCAPVRFDETKDCSLFREYLSRVQPDEKIQKFLQQFAGICLTGYQPEPGLLFFHGEGANGKTVFVQVLRHLLGEDYHFPAKKELFFNVDKFQFAKDNDKIDLEGKRLVTAAEADEDSGKPKWNIGMIKTLIGGETTHGRQLYGEGRGFTPVCKAIVSMNVEPELSSFGEALSRRFLKIPWDVIIPEKERTRPVERFVKMLLENGGDSGVLNWMLEGLAAVRENKWDLSVPQNLRAATDEYFGEYDLVKTFKEEWCSEKDEDAPPPKDDAQAKLFETNPEARFWIYTDKLYNAFEIWGAGNDRAQIAVRRFNADLKRLIGKKRFRRATGNKTQVQKVFLNAAAKTVIEKIKGAANSAR